MPSLSVLRTSQLANCQRSGWVSQTSGPRLTHNRNLRIYETVFIAMKKSCTPDDTPGISVPIRWELGIDCLLRAAVAPIINTCAKSSPTLTLKPSYVEAVIRGLNHAVSIAQFLLCVAGAASSGKNRKPAQSPQTDRKRHDHVQC